MKKVNNYNIEKIIDALEFRGWTNFVSPENLILIRGKLSKDKYNIYYCYQEATKVLLYKKEKPNIKLLKINCKGEIRHQDVMGTLYSLGIKEEMFGDIVKWQNSFYFFVMESILQYIKCNLLEIREYKVILEEVDLSVADNFFLDYEEIILNVTSLRMDNVLASLIKVSRSEIEKKIQNKEIILNYQNNYKMTRSLKENDVFSIRKYGKFKFLEVIRITKKGSFVIKIIKYI